jgi:hypothetical protein
MYKLTEKAPPNAIVQVTPNGDVYDLSAYGSREAAWESEKTEWWVAEAESEAAAEAEFKATLYEYSQSEILFAAENGEAWPFDFNYVQEKENEN